MRHTLKAAAILALAALACNYPGEAPAPEPTPVVETITAPPPPSPPPSPTTAYTPVFEPGSCPVAITGYTPECGTLLVPQDRANPAGLQLRLAVMIFRAQSPDPQPAPVVYLSGGP
ncbi:MAG: alpha/beta hydrolase, partial [Anaerolineae bacterium]